MRSQQLYLADILDAASQIETFLAGLSRDAFLDNALVRSAILQQLTVIGEASSRLSPAIRQRHDQIAWRRVIAFRNRAVHAYFNVDWSIVWTTATTDVPALAREVAAILAVEYPSEESR